MTFERALCPRPCYEWQSNRFAIGSTRSSFAGRARQNCCAQAKGQANVLPQRADARFQYGRDKRGRSRWRHCQGLARDTRSRVSCLRSPLLPLYHPNCFAARVSRRWRSGTWRADMGPKTRDLPGGHETLRLNTLRLACTKDRNMICYPHG